MSYDPILFPLIILGIFFFSYTLYFIFSYKRKIHEEKFDEKFNEIIKYVEENKKPSIRVEIINIKDNNNANT